MTPPRPTPLVGLARRTGALLAACLALAGCGRKPAPEPAEAGTEPPAVAVGTPPAAPAAAGPGRHEPYPFRRAVLVSVGIDRCPKLRGLPDLQFAEADARAVSDVFDRLYGFEVVPLYGAAADKAAIEGTLRRLAGELGDGDVLVVFFAGHGLVVPAEGGDRAGYLVPADADLDATDLRDTRRWAAQAIDMRRLAADVEAMNARHVLVIADACCSGFMASRGALSRADLKTFLFQKSRAVLAATTQSQAARENAAARHGHFTAALLDELRRDDAMSVIDVFASVVRRVAAETNGTMTPTLGHFGGGEGTFVFIPRSIPRSEIEADLGGRTPGAEPPKGLAGVVSRQRERLALVTTEADAYRAMVSRSYAFAPRAEELRREWEKRFDCYRENAGAGDPWAMAALHVCYARGLGTPKNPELAYFWARRLDGFAKPAGAGRFFLAECYRQGLAVEKSEPAAERLNRESADLGFLPGRVFAADRSLREKSPSAEKVAEAKKVLERGRERKYPPAIMALALLHDGTIGGMKPDYKTATALFEEAAALGDTTAMIFACKALAGGRPGVPRDVARAERLLRDAAEAGNARAQYQLALEYTTGDPARVLGLKADDREMLRWALLAAEQEHADAQCVVARAYLFGYGTEKNADLARRWCERAAEKNCPDAFNLQGRWYLTGEVYGAKDPAKAAERYRRAADLGHPQACKVLATLLTEDGQKFGGANPHWLDILHYNAQAAKLGALDTKEATNRLLDAYLKYVNQSGEREERWLRFWRTHPESARVATKILQENTRRLDWFSLEKVEPVPPGR